MAIPTFVAVGTSAGSAAAITPGMPAGVLVDDILLLFLETQNQVITVSGGTETWAQVADSPQGTNGDTASNPTRLTIFWARASQNTPTSPTTSDSGDHQLGQIMAIRGCITAGNPWDVTAGSTDAVLHSTDFTASIPGDTTTIDDCLVIAALTLESSNCTINNTWANASLSSVTQRINIEVGPFGDGGVLGVATGGKALAGVYGATTVTVDVPVGDATGGSGMISIALLPAEEIAIRPNNQATYLQAVNRGAFF